MRAHLDEDEVGAGFGEGDGEGLADAARGSRYGGGVALEREQRGGHGGRMKLRLVVVGERTEQRRMADAGDVDEGGGLVEM